MFTASYAGLAKDAALAFQFPTGDDTERATATAVAELVGQALPLFAGDDDYVEIGVEGHTNPGHVTATNRGGEMFDKLDISIRRANPPQE